MEAASRGSGLAKQPTLEDRSSTRRSPHFENVDEVVQELQELETENDELRKEVLRLTDSQERRGSLGDSSVDPFCRRSSAASRRKGSVLSVRRSWSRRDSLDLSGQLEAAMQENEELSDRLRFLEQERQRAQEHQAGREAAMAELSARMRQLEQEHEELGSRHEHLVAMMATRANLTPATGSTMRSSRPGSIDMSADAGKMPVDLTGGHFKRSSCEVLVEAPLKRSLNAAQTQVVGLEVDLASTRLDRDNLLKRMGQLEAECEELRTMLGQQREAAVKGRLEVERLQEELLLERQPSPDARRTDSKAWDLLRQLMQAGNDLNVEDTRPRRGSTGSTCSDRAGVSPTRCEASEAQDGAILSLQMECAQLREELSRLREDSREAREDAARVPELLSDIVRLQDELATAQTTIRRYEEQSSPDLWTRMIDSIACTGSRPLPPQPHRGDRPVKLAVPSGG